VPNEVVLGVVIRADGTAAVRQIGDVRQSVDKMGGDIKSTFETMKEHWLAGTAVAYGFYRTIEKGWRMAEEAARVEEQMASLDALAGRYGTTAQQIVDRIGQVSGGLIGQAAAAEVAAQSLFKQLKPDQIYQLAEATETLSNVTGKTAADSFRELSAAVALGRELAMEGTAGAIDLQQATHGLSATMSESERRHAMFNEIIARANELKRQGVGATDSSADKLERFGNVVSGASRQVGSFLLQAIVPLAEWMTVGIRIAQRHTDVIAALAMVVGSYVAAQFLAGSAAVAKFAWGMLNLGDVIKSFATVSLGPMLANPLTWLAVAIGAAAYAYSLFRKEAEAAKKAQDDFAASLKAGSLDTAGTMVNVLADDLAKAEANVAAWQARTSELKGTRWGWDKDLIDARAATRGWKDEVERLQELLNVAQDAEKKMSASSPGPGTDGYSERLKRLEDLEREYRDRKNMAETDELNQELERLNIWFGEQSTVLKRLDADQKQYDALNAAYDAQWVVDSRNRNQKVIQDLADSAKYELDLEKQLSQARAEIDLQDAQARISYEQKILAFRQQAGWISDTAAIQEKYRLEAEGLDAQLAKVMELQRAEGLSQAEKERNAAENKRLQEEINRLKGYEIYELDVRRLTLDREISELKKQQRDLALEMRLRYAGEAAGKMGGEGAGIGQAMIGIAEIAADQDPYTKDFERWSEGQDKMVMAMEERYQADLERLQQKGLDEAAILEQTENQKAAIMDAYRQYDLQYDLMSQQQKFSVQMAYAQMAMGLVNTAAAFTGGKSKELFIASRSIMAAMSIISGHAAAMAALAPPPLGLGPALGAPLSIAMKALGYINAAAIMATAFMGAPGGGGGGGSVSGGGVPSIGSSSSPSAPATVREPTKAGAIVNIHIYGNIVDQDAFARELIPSITKALEDGVT